MILPVSCQLAIITIVDIALHARPHPVCAKILAQRNQLPARHLEPLLQKLVKARLLKSVRGPRGGYELAKERRKISLGTIVRAALKEEGEASVMLPAIMETLMSQKLEPINQAFLAKLDAITIDQLCQDYDTLARSVTNNCGEVSDFII